MNFSTSCKTLGIFSSNDSNVNIPSSAISPAFPIKNVPIAAAYKESFTTDRTAVISPARISPVPPVVRRAQEWHHRIPAARRQEPGNGGI